LPCFLLILLFTVGVGNQAVLAQKKPHPDSVAFLNERARQTLRFCKAPDLPDAERLRLDKSAQLALQLKRAGQNNITGISWVPVRAHIFRRSNGTGDFDLTRLNRVIALNNRYFLSNGIGIQFFLAGTTPDYIDNDILYGAFPDGDESSVAGRDAPNAMNVYFVNQFTTSGLQGYAYFPANSLASTRSFIRSDVSMTDEFLGSILLPHEWGHSFNLFHTFQGATGSTPELVTRGAGANCSTAGDLLCDTPADPYGRAGATVSYATGCPVYTGTATDSQGATYAPSMDNIMSYYDGCAPFFSAGQYDRIQAGLALRQTHTAYSLTHPSASVNAPTGLVVVQGSSGHASLKWQDNATNEMGYVIERATSTSGPFIPIGGTAPNVTFFTDAQTANSASYVYRVRPSNTTDAVVSNTVSYVAAPSTNCVPTLSIGCAQGDGLADLYVNGATLNRQSGCSALGYHEFTPASLSVSAGQSVRVGGRLLGSHLANGVSIFLDYDQNGSYSGSERVYSQYVTGTFQADVDLPANLPTGLLRMRVIVTRGVLPTSACFSDTYGETEDYTLLVTPTACALPTNPQTVVQNTTAQLSWSAASGATTYDLRWKAITSEVWNTTAGLTATTYTLDPVVAGSEYQWQVRSGCGAGTSSVWVGQTFLAACQAPTNLTATNVLPTSVLLGWAGSSATYDLFYRLDGASSWISVAGLTSTSLALTGLLPGRAYQWQIRCGGSTNNPLSPVATFYTAGTCFITSANGCTDNDGFNSLTFNGVQMSQNSGCSANAYRSFSNPVAPVVAGRSYAFSGTLLSSQWSQGISIWLDLNRNNVFESSERLYTATSTVTTAYSGTLPIPITATPGPVRMRMVSAYSAIPTDPCGSYSYGEAEEYMLMVYANDVVQITTHPTPACPSVALPLSFGTTMPFGSSNVFTVQLSDAAGTFGTSPVVIGSVQAPGSQTLNVTVPANTAAGNDYRLRVVSSDPATTNNPTTPIRIAATCSCPVPTSLAVGYTTVSSANLIWQTDATVASYSLRWRVRDGLTWNTLTGITATEYFLRGLSGSNVQYEWQVQANCLNGQPSGWSNLATFTPGSCGVATLGPETQQITNATPATLTVNFTGASPWNFSLTRNDTEAAGTYTGITTTPYTFTVAAPSLSVFRLGSASGTCGTYAVNGSANVSVICGTPVSLTTTSINVTSAVASWTGEATLQYELRWRAINSSTWSGTTVAPVAGLNSYTITPLSGSTAYEWQVRSVCTEGTSVFSGSTLFTTLSPSVCQTMVTTKSGLWTDPTVWSCGRIPVNTDYLEVLAGHTITIPANTTASARIVRQVGQVVLADASAMLRLGPDLNLGLVAYYPFDGDANDASGNNLHATAYGPTLATDRFGNANKAYSFNGTDNWMKVAPNAAFHQNDFTIATWVRPEDGPYSFQILLSYPAISPFDNAWIFYFDPGQNYLKAYIGSGYHMASNINWLGLQNTWRHVVFRKQGAQAQLYLDGTLLGTFVMPTGVPYTNPGGLLIGAEDDDGNGIAERYWFKGLLDDIRVYNRGLSAQEIRVLANEK
jgi:hypothetical protein